MIRAESRQRATGNIQIMTNRTRVKEGIDSSDIREFDCDLLFSDPCVH